MGGKSVSGAWLPGVLAKLEEGSIAAQSQDESVVTVTRLVKKEDGRIQWSRDSAEIERMTRAYDSWPGAFTNLRGKNLKVIAVRPAPGLPADRHSGVVTVSEVLEAIRRAK